MTHEDRSAGGVATDSKVCHLSFPAILYLAALSVLVLVIWAAMSERLILLERICHGQCKYGDAECAKRCEDAGHCEAE